MTTTPAALTPQPLWSDDDIANDAKRASSNPTIQALIRSCLLFMRSGYEAKLDGTRRRLTVSDTPAALAPLWGPRRIDDAINEKSQTIVTEDNAAWRIVGVLTAVRIMRKIEYDYMQRLETLHATIATQAAELVEKQKYILELERELAKWRPANNTDGWALMAREWEEPVEADDGNAK